jgi:hypothetical protein
MITGLLAALPVLFAPLNGMVVIYKPYMNPIVPSVVEGSVILSRILGKYQTKCVDGDGSVPHITSVVSGSFTDENKKEKLYTVHFSDCSPTHSNNFGKTRVYIVQDGKVVFNADSDGVVIKTIDSNNDGHDEWVMKTTFCNQGTCVESASLNGICGDQVIEYRKFETVYESNCGGYDDNKMVKYQTISLLFNVDFFDPVVIPTFETKKCGPKD